MNQIARTFILIGLVVVILLALHFLPKLSIGENELRRVNVLSDVLPEVYQNDEDLNFIPAVPEPPKPIITERTIQPSNEGDTISHPSRQTASTEQPHGQEQTDSTQANPTVVNGQTDGVTPILDYSEGQAGGMSHFYHQLASVQQLGRPVRVAYYGDSFIEGDIFTADLRELLQTQFGGNGVGWVDCASQVSGFRQTVGHTYSGIKEYEVVKRPFSAANQGIAQRYFTAAQGARITYKGSRVRKHLAQWDKSTFYLRSENGLTLKTTLNSDTTVVDTVPGTPNLQTVERKADSTAFSSISYNFSNIGGGTLLYGVALEPFHGVVVDNFSMRGSAGYTLSQIPAATLAQFAALRPYDLIVVHFGLNVANSNQSNYSSYTKNMGQAIAHLRQAYPQASILVVSMPDRDQRSASGLRTMKGVEALIAYQQIMASDLKVSFFNLFEAMGGRESMKDLVERGLANKDYTHINFAGGKYLAKILFESLMAGYHSYGY